MVAFNVIPKTQQLSFNHTQEDYTCESSHSLIFMLMSIKLFILLNIVTRSWIFILKYYLWINFKNSFSPFDVLNFSAIRMSDFYLFESLWDVHHAWERISDVVCWCSKQVCRLNFMLVYIWSPAVRVRFSRSTVLVLKFIFDVLTLFPDNKNNNNLVWWHCRCVAPWNSKYNLNGSFIPTEWYRTNANFKKITFCSCIYPHRIYNIEIMLTFIRKCSILSKENTIMI